MNEVLCCWCKERFRDFLDGYELSIENFSQMDDRYFVKKYAFICKDCAKKVFKV